MTAILGRTGNLVGFTTGRGTTPWNTEMEAALRKMDAMLASTVVSITNTLPGSANEGDLYLVGTSPTGVAAGWANRIARWRSSPAGWEAYQPMQGWIITIVGESTNKIRRYNGTAWVALAADTGAEPYAGVPAQMSFWRSTAAGVREWVQLVAADITDLATTLAGYLTKTNPTFTGTMTGPAMRLTGNVAINGALMPAWDAARKPMMIGRTAALWEADYGSGSCAGLSTNYWFDGSNSKSLSASGYSQVVLIDPAGNLRYEAVANNGVNGNVAPLTKWSVDKDGMMALNGTTRITAGGDGRFVGLRASEVAGTGTRPLVALSDGTIDDQDASTFRSTISAAPSPSRATISASTLLGGISASAIYIPTTDVNLTLEGGVDGQGWDIYSTLSFGLVVPSGTSLYAYNGIDTGPKTRPVGGGRAIRVVRLTANIWLVPNMSW